jgi:nucleoside 2-deoxyribosyltransferase
MAKRKSAKTIFLDTIRKSLDKQGINYLQSVYAGGTAADFFFQTQTSGSVILQAKNWEPTDENLAWAKRIADSTKKGANVNQAYVVIPSDIPLNPKNGILSPGQIPDVIRTSIINPQKRIKSPEVVKLDAKHQIFAAMPFKDIYEDTFRVAIEPACTAVDARCIRVDKEPYAGDITQKILTEIAQSDLVIADISETRPNVMYEYGYAKGKDKPIIPICSTDANEIPFDIRQENTLFYKKGQTYLLRDVLVERLTSLLK